MTQSFCKNQSNAILRQSFDFNIIYIYKCIYLINLCFFEVKIVTIHVSPIPIRCHIYCLGCFIRHNIFKFISPDFKVRFYIVLFPLHGFCLIYAIYQLWQTIVCYYVYIGFSIYKDLGPVVQSWVTELALPQVILKFKANFMTASL